MTREQSRMFAGIDNQQQGSRFEPVKKLSGLDRQPVVCEPNSSELENHHAFWQKFARYPIIFYGMRLSDELVGRLRDNLATWISDW